MDHTQIKTFEDACKALNLDANNTIPDFSAYPEKHRAAMVAESKLVLVAQALNGGWEPDWQDEDEYKYTPWFDFDDENAEARFSYCGGCHYWCQRSGVGSRLCYKSREIARYAGTQFIDLYREVYVIK